MKLVKILILISGCLVLKTHAAESTVQPGIDTLKTAVVNANSGDVLNLMTGTYSFTGIGNFINIQKALTIKRNSKSAKLSFQVELPSSA